MINGERKASGFDLIKTGDLTLTASDLDSTTLACSLFETGSLTSLFVVVLSAPSVEISAKTSPTATTSSFWKRISVIVPLQGEGTSLSTLSVATSKIISSASTLSPTCFNQLIRVASEILSPILGILNSTIILFEMKENRV